MSTQQGVSAECQVRVVSFLSVPGGKECVQPGQIFDMLCPHLADLPLMIDLDVSGMSLGLVEMLAVYSS